MTDVTPGTPAEESPASLRMTGWGMIGFGVVELVAITIIGVVISQPLVFVALIAGVYSIVTGARTLRKARMLPPVAENRVTRD